MNRLTTVSLALLLGLSGPTVQANDTVVEIEAKGYAFVPQEVTVKRGATVRWINAEKRQYHSVWFKAQGEKPGEYFFPGETYQRTFDTPGTFPYVCEPHEKTHDMRGVIHVVE